MSTVIEKLENEKEYGGMIAVESWKTRWNDIVLSRWQHMILWGQDCPSYHTQD